MFCHVQQFRGRNKWLILEKGYGKRSRILTFNIGHTLEKQRGQHPDGNASENTKLAACKCRQMTRKAREGRRPAWLKRPLRELRQPGLNPWKPFANQGEKPEPGLESGSSEIKT